MDVAGPKNRCSDFSAPLCVAKQSRGSGFIPWPREMSVPPKSNLSDLPCITPIVVIVEQGGQVGDRRFVATRQGSVCLANYLRHRQWIRRIPVIRIEDRCRRCAQQDSRLAVEPGASASLKCVEQRFILESRLARNAARNGEYSVHLLQRRVVAPWRIVCMILPEPRRAAMADARWWWRHEANIASLEGHMFPLLYCPVRNEAHRLEAAAIPSERRKARRSGCGEFLSDQDLATHVREVGGSRCQNLAIPERDSEELGVFCNDIDIFGMKIESYLV